MYPRVKVTVDLLQNLEVRTPKGKHAPAHPSRFRERSELRRPMSARWSYGGTEESYVDYLVLLGSHLREPLSVPHRKRDGCSRKFQECQSEVVRHVAPYARGTRPCDLAIDRNLIKKSCVPSIWACCSNTVLYFFFPPFCDARTFLRSVLQWAPQQITVSIIDFGYALRSLYALHVVGG
jgi:hypothetical protein